jgi:hypothetical protein
MAKVAHCRPITVQPAARDGGEIQRGNVYVESRLAQSIGATRFSTCSSAASTGSKTEAVLRDTRSRRGPTSPCPDRPGWSCQVEQAGSIRPFLRIVTGDRLPAVGTVIRHPLHVTHRLAVITDPSVIVAA